MAVVYSFGGPGTVKTLVEIMARCLNHKYPDKARPWTEAKWETARTWVLDGDYTEIEAHLRALDWRGKIEYIPYSTLTKWQRKKFGWGQDCESWGPGHAILGATNWHEDKRLRVPDQAWGHPNA